MDNKQKNRGSIARAAFLAFLSLLMTVTVAATLTFALFTDGVEKENRIEAGTLAITVQMTERTGVRLNPTTGKLENDTSINVSSPVDLKEYDQKLFNIVNAVPGCEQTVKISLINGELGNNNQVINSVLAVNYYVQLAQIEHTNTLGNNGEVLKSLIEVTIKDENGNPVKTMMLNAADVESPVDLGELAPGATGKFTITAKFVTDGDSNGARGGVVTFDIKIIAEQVES